MPPFPKYSKSIGKALANAANKISNDEDSYALLDSLSQYIHCQRFSSDYSCH